jgi:hypothetical protein
MEGGFTEHRSKRHHKPFTFLHNVIPLLHIVIPHGISTKSCRVMDSETNNLILPTSKKKQGQEILITLYMRSSLSCEPVNLSRDGSTEQSRLKYTSACSIA